MKNSVLRKRILAKLTTDTGLLEPTERNLGVERVSAVDPSGTSVQPVSDTQSTVDALAEHGGRKTIVGVVRLLDDIVFVMELDDDTDGAEDLLTHDLHVGLRLSEDSWLDEEAFCSVAFATEVHLRARLLTRVDVVHDALRDRGQ